MIHFCTVVQTNWRLARLLAAMPTYGVKQIVASTICYMAIMTSYGMVKYALVVLIQQIVIAIICLIPSRQAAGT